MFSYSQLQALPPRSAPPRPQGLKGLGSCVEFFSFSETGSPFRIPHYFSCSFLSWCQAVNRSEKVLVAPAPFASSAFVRSFSTLSRFSALTALLIAFCSWIKAWGRSCHFTQEEEVEEELAFLVSWSDVCFSLIIFSVLALLLHGRPSLLCIVELKVLSVPSVEHLFLCLLLLPSSSPRDQQADRAMVAIAREVNK